MARSRTNYIHLNRNNITVGVRGTEKTVFKLEGAGGIITTLQEVTNRLEKLNQINVSNSYFPSWLFGGGGTQNALTGKAAQYANDILNRRNLPMSPHDVRRAFQTLNTFQDPTKLERAYYTTVKQYYKLPNATPWQYVKEVANAGGLIYVPQPSNPDFYNQSDPTRIQEWLIDKIEQIAAIEGRDARHDGIARIDRLNTKVAEKVQLEEGLELAQTLRSVYSDYFTLYNITEDFEV